MSRAQPIIRVPAGWTYAETSAFDFDRWVTTYAITHDACGTVKSETCRPVGDGGDAGWYYQKCAEGLAFFIGDTHRVCDKTNAN